MFFNNPALLFGVNPCIIDEIICPAFDLRHTAGRVRRAEDQHGQGEHYEGDKLDTYLPYRPYGSPFPTISALLTQIPPNADLTHMIDRLRAPALAEGYRHIERLCADWSSGANRFDRPGERFLLVHDDAGAVLACGGLNIDPFEPDGRTGRIRRVYVAPSARGAGLGRTLITALLADHPFTQIGVRAGSEAAGRFYARLGFVAVSHPTRTHLLATPHGR